VAHFLGWILHGLILRDFVVLNCWSLLTEFVEYTFEVHMPVYSECWWDSLLIDVIMSNLPGMIIARLIIKYSGVEDFDWLGRKGKSSFLEWDVWTK